MSWLGTVTKTEGRIWNKYNNKLLMGEQKKTLWGDFP